MPPHYGNIGQPSRDERVQIHGILCEDEVTWNDWTPGVESVKDLVLQNVFLVTQEVKFQLPGTKEFDMPYPEAFRLAPGMRKTIPISFRPSKYEPHVDQVKIITKAGNFFVTVKATVKDIALFVPPFLDFGVCPTIEKTEVHLDVYNTGTLKASVKWHAAAPFAVTCPSSTIEVGQMMRCTVDFTPATASVFDGLVVCEAQACRDSDKTLGLDLDSPNDLPPPKAYYVKSTGVGKMPHLCVAGQTHPEVDFGSVFPGNRMPRTVEILNTTPVRASFRVAPLHDSSEVSPLPPYPFTVIPDTGVVEPHGKCTLTFYFQSHTVKEHACQRFQVTTPGGIPLIIKCSAHSKPMAVRLSTRSINFGEVRTGKIYPRTVQIHNDSDRPAAFHFINVNDKAGVFTLDRPHGIVPANSFMVISVSFAPLASINYCKEVSCVVKGALHVLPLHLIGTAHSEKARPARLDQRHINTMRELQLRGIKEHPPPTDKKMAPTAMEEEMEMLMADDNDENTPHGPEDPQVSATQRFLELMLPSDARQRDIAVSVDSLDFGNSSTLTMGEKKTVTVTNRTSQKVCVTWLLPGESRMAISADDQAILGVYPTHCDIGPRSSQDFAVSFTPRTDCCYEGDLLEAVVYQKVNRTFRLVDLDHFTPPWMISVRGLGHTMGHTRNDPRLDLSESQIRFRACLPGERTYQVTMLTNPGDTTITYRFLPPIDTSQSDATGGGLPDPVPFRVWPENGVIPPHQFHLVVLEFAPLRAKNEVAYVATFQIVVDYNESHPKTLKVSGRSWVPTVRFCQSQPMVTFPPTSAGIASSLDCLVRNVSEIPISVECRIPARYRKIFSFATPSQILMPSQSSYVRAHFCPEGEQVFSAPLYCVARPLEDEDNEVRGPLKALMNRRDGLSSEPNYVLQLVGHGREPALVLEPDSLDLGAVRARDEVRNQVVLLNSSNLTVHFTVKVEFLPNEDAGVMVPSKEVGEEAIRVETMEGELAGRCNQKMEILFRPAQCGLYEYRIALTPRGTHSKSGRPIVLNVRADVQYPTIQVADLRSECSAPQPQSMMWTQFQVDGINSLFKSEVTEVEREFQRAIGIDAKKRLVDQLKPFQLLFGTSAAGSRPTVVYLTLTNPSRLKVRFSFQTPKDLNLENAPYWCDEKALTDEREAHFSWVEEHGIYDISPRGGEIPPGDYLHVKLTYNHDSIGTHILPVVFNVHDSRSVLLYLKAHSVSPTVGCLSVRSAVVALQPVPLDANGGTTQPVELTNSGCIPAPWRVDVDSIVDFNLGNHAFQVLSVYPTEGILAAQSSTFLHFTFTPLEAKKYSCPVRVEMLKDGSPCEELIFELKAEGYDPESEKPTPEPFFPPTLPIQTYAPVPGCAAALSIELLDFGCCPQRAWTSRMLVMVNYSSEYVLGFRWQSRGLFEAGELRIEPSSGELAPESHLIVVFRVCSETPVDISSEIACQLQWTHVQGYRKKTDEFDANLEQTPPEYFAFHKDHVHEKIKTGKDFLAGQAKHVSVANRLTVSRFRNLMSSAAGQKFLNDNLHRTALLSTHLPTMMGRSNMLPDTKGQPISPPPTSIPLYIRVRAVIADWAVPEDRRDNFLVLTPGLVASLHSEAATANAAEAEQCLEKDREQDYDNEKDILAVAGNNSLNAEGVALGRRSARTMTALSNMTSPQGGGLGLESVGPGDAYASVMGSEPGGDFGNVGAAVPGGVSQDVAAGVLEEMLREIAQSSDFDEILDGMIMQQPPLYVQLEDSPGPGDHPVPVESDVLKASIEMVRREAEELEANWGLEASMAQEEADEAAEGAFRSDLLLDFEEPVLEEVRLPWKSASSAPSAPAPKNAAETVQNNPPNPTPQSYWEEGRKLYGEVDPEVFRRDAGEVLEHLLLDMVDDVIAGRLNWMRPMPRPRNRR